MIELNGRRLGVDAAIAADYDAFQEGAALVDLASRGRMRFSGGGAQGALNGLLTCDVAALTPGHGSYGVALTNKGKVLADLWVFAMDDSWVVETSAATWETWKQLVAKYINPRLAKRTDETATTSSFAIAGPGAASIAARIAGVETPALEELAPYAHRSAGSVNVARIPDFGVAAFRIAVTDEGATRARAIDEGARLVGPDAVEALRIEAGRPVYGVDMDDSTIPQEANLDALGAISYTKGCYTGQEVVARLRFRGHVNRRLMGLRVDGPVAPPRGAILISGEGKESGEIRSTVVSPRFGAIAIGMVRREVAAGDRVTVRHGEAQFSAEVTPLPFGS